MYFWECISVNIHFQIKWPLNFLQLYKVEPPFNEPLFNEVLDITNDILCPGQSYSEMYGIEPRYKEHNPEAQTVKSPSI